MTHARQATGRLGEELAAGHLTAAGWRIVARNWRGPGGEIDIVAEDADCLVLVEVRTRRSMTIGLAEESLGTAKQRRMARLAQAYVLASGWRGPWRVDAITVALGADDSVRRLAHYRDAVLW